ncbi:MAG: ribulose-phosphate 3-epimerase [Pyrinomonadaceae bacterium]
MKATNRIEFGEPFEIAPSLLSANFACLANDISAVKDAGVKVLHVDVMDGRFVPNITIGLPVVKSLRKATDLLLDCHLMIVEPSRYAAQFVEAGADMVSVHIEADVHIHRTLTAIKEAGARAGVAINPGTSLQSIEAALPFADYVLLMSVNPGFGGQSFIETSFQRIRQLKDMIQNAGLSTVIEIDGGIGEENICDVVSAGAEIIVAGSAVFGDGEPETAIKNLRERANAWV